LLCSEYKLPDIPHVTENDSVARIYNELPGLEDKNALIIKVSYTCYWYEGTISNIVAYQNDGTIIKYDAFYPFKGKGKIKKKKLSKKKASRYHTALT
jgi:prophage tail gpP-like protein